MNTVRAVLREPLVGFLLGGLLLFGLYRVVAPRGAGLADDEIEVDREALLTFLQYRARTFEAERAAAALEALDAPALEEVIDQYVTEEALYREALALGLDRDDNVIKRRLVQKVVFLAEAPGDAPTISEAEVQTWFAAHAADYRVEAHATFTHVFFDAERRGVDGAWAAAVATLAELNAVPVPFHDAPQYGDRFQYHVNYVQRTPDRVASHFGTDLADAVFAAPVDGAWRGPFRSPYGSHLVLLADRQPAHQPSFAEVGDRVAEDAQRAAVRERRDAALQAIVDRYRPRIRYTGSGP